MSAVVQTCFVAARLVFMSNNNVACFVAILVATVLRQGTVTEGAKPVTRSTNDCFSTVWIGRISVMMYVVMRSSTFACDMREAENSDD